jgi:hypothetical protein
MIVLREACRRPPGHECARFSLALARPTPKQVKPVSGSYKEIVDGYLDVGGVYRSIDRQTRAAVEKALGPVRPPVKFEVQAQRCYQPTAFDAGGRVWAANACRLFQPPPS